MPPPANSNIWHLSSGNLSRSLKSILVCPASSLKLSASATEVGTSISVNLGIFSDSSLSSNSYPPLVVSVLASLIDRAVAKSARNFFSANKDSRIRVFDSRRVPDMSIQCFLDGVFRYARVAPPVFLVSYVYIDRLCELNPCFFLSACNANRLLITAVLVASKFVEDMYAAFLFLSR